MEEETKEKSFVVKDRRKFTETGESRSEEAEEEQSGTRAEAKIEEEKEKPPGKGSEEPYVPEMNFSNFIFSLGTTVMFHFGDFPDPVTKKSERNLAAAKQTIDILGMLKEKTEGNLNPDERSMLDTLLFELRMRYVKEKDKG